MRFSFSILKVSVFGLSLLLAACSEPQTKKPAADGEALPPSLRSEAASPKAQIIRLTDKQAGELNIKTVTIKTDAFSYQLSLPGLAFAAPDRISVISAPISGRIANVFVQEGDAVKKNQLLIELESLEFANLASDYLKAKAEEKYQHSQLKRIELLVKKKISPQRALDKAQADYSRAVAGAKAAHARLLAIGVRQKQIDAWDTGRTDQPRLRIYAPISGVVTQHHIKLGQAVNEYEEMMTIIDLEKIMIKGYASPEEGTVIQPGDSVIITLKDYPNRKLESTIRSINPALDPINKSITVNIIALTPQQWPKPGQNVRLHVKVKTAEPVVSVPLAAVEYEGDRPTVFVKIGQNAYEKRFIRIRKITSDAAILESGLKPGEQVAVTQVFSLKALGKFEEFAE